LLSEDRNWAENLAIQATANAFGVTIEIINSNQLLTQTRIGMGAHASLSQLPHHTIIALF